MPRTLLALAVFFVSGAAALLYQVIWQRLLVFFSGADVHSASVVVAAFMAGLGCGSFVGGQIADRVSRATSLLLFAVAELAVAAFGVISATFFYDFLYSRFAHLELGLTSTALVLFLGLLWPTVFMGASLPLLARGLTTDVGRAASTVGWLYALNTLGAAAGALTATWLLIPQLGLDGSLRVAAAMNLCCAVAALPLALARRPAAPPTAPAGVVPTVESGGGQTPEPATSLTSWVGLFALSGFLAVSLEIVWFRLLGVMLKSTSFTFGSLLAVYLAGLALGSGAGSAIATRTRRPALWFLVLQAGAGAYAALSLTLFVAGLDGGGAFAWFAVYFGQYDGVDVRGAVAFFRGLVSDAGSAPRDMLWLYACLPALLVGPPTIMAGISFPLLQRIVQTDLSRLGRRVGALLAANVVGSTIGAFVTGLLFLDRMGTAGTLKVLYVMSAAFAALAVGRMPFTRPLTRAAARTALALLVAGVLVAMPDGQTLWSRLHGATSRSVIQGEDGTGLSVLRGERQDFRRTVVYVNGLGQSWIPYGGIHTVLGALPAFVHPHPRSAVLIGLGSGDTLFAMAGRAELERITSVEIIAPQLRTLEQLVGWQGYPGLATLLRDPRIRQVTGDGRLYLQRSRERYDIVQADALRPHSAYAGNLYSDAYFSLLKDRLNPGGLAVTWAPTPRILRTFLTVFPYVWHQGEIAIGSDAPIGVDREAIERRLSRPGVDSYYTAAAVNVRELLGPYLAGSGRVYDPSFDRSAIADINTDLNPRDEFEIPALIDLPFQGRS